MQRNDFKKGQTVYLLLVGNAARGRHTDAERIQEWQVQSVGRKYITVRHAGWAKSWEVKFDIDNDFRQVTNGSIDYVLYLSEASIRYDLEKESLVREIRKLCDKRDTFKNLSNEKLGAIYNLLTGRS